MIILPDRNVPRAKFLKPVLTKQWRTPSCAQKKDQLGNENHTRFKVEARLNDGHLVWRGWFDDRGDFDAFLWSMLNGTLAWERPLWDLSTPSWYPGLGEHVTYYFATQVIKTTPTGSSSYTIPADWSAVNNIDTIGGGGSGSAANMTGGGNSIGLGGGGGAWSRATNATKFGESQIVTVSIGIGGAGITTANNTTVAVSGNAGGDTWFGDTTLAGANTVSGAKGGSATTAIISATQNTVYPGTSGGVGTSGVGTTRNNGGGSGSVQNTGTGGGSASGGGGAGGLNGAGVTSANVVTSGAATSAGGSGDNGSGGAGGTAGTGTNTATAGGAGTEYTTAGSGGGGGGNRGASGIAGAGGNYGGGGGGCSAQISTTTVTSGAGIQGAIVITYTPSSGVNVPQFFTFSFS